MFQAEDTVGMPSVNLARRVHPEGLTVRFAHRINPVRAMQDF